MSRLPDPGALTVEEAVEHLCRKFDVPMLPKGEHPLRDVAVTVIAGLSALVEDGSLDGDNFDRDIEGLDLLNAVGRNFARLSQRLMSAVAVEAGIDFERFTNVSDDYHDNLGSEIGGKVAHMETDAEESRTPWDAQRAWGTLNHQQTGVTR